MWSEIKSNPEAVIALAALLVSIISILFTWRSLRQQQRHNEISVRPVLHIGRSDYEDCIELSVSNRGIGPAKITAQMFLVEGKRIEVEKFVDLMPRIAEPWSDFSGSLEDRMVSAGATLKIISFSGERATNSPQTVYEIRKALSSISVSLDYEDLYGNKFQVMSDLNWYGRNL